ncbi:MAG TPA: hypothetical protein VLF20_03415 [Patescibacteria group bacterium]|nr:hypothetical protein [Patescibacteria group bacterium]
MVKKVFPIDTNIDSHILRINLIEFLTSYLEGRTAFDVVLQVTERIYQRDPSTLSPVIIDVVTTFHEVKIQFDAGEEIQEDTVKNTVNDLILRLLEE